MSKQRKSPERRTRSAKPAQEQRASAGRGNEAMQDQIRELDAGELDAVQAVALPVVERAVLALQLTPEDQGVIDGFVDLLERSHLPQDRKNALADRLRHDELTASAVKTTMERWFGDANERTRVQVGDALHQVWSLLGAGEASPTGDAWVVEDQRWTLSDGTRQGSLEDRAEALVREVADQAHPEGVAGAKGADLQGFCRDIALLVALEEEEEEWLDEPPYPDL